MGPRALHTDRARLVVGLQLAAALLMAQQVAGKQGDPVLVIVNIGPVSRIPANEHNGLVLNRRQLSRNSG